MNLLRLPTTSRSAALLPTVADLVGTVRPDAPMHCLRPDAIVAAAANFVAGFPGDVLYAVKCNPEPAVLRAVWDGGVRHFDCASAPEVALVRAHVPGRRDPLHAPGEGPPGDPRRLGAPACATSSLDSAGELAKIRAGDRRRRRARPVRAPRPAARPRGLRPVRQVRRPGGGSRRPAARRPARMPRGSACASMSARSASTRWPGATPWRWPARRSARPAWRSR